MDDNRIKCSDEKKVAIKASRIATAHRRKTQILKVYECKIVEKRLSKAQKEQLQKLFCEGKWFYNHVLNIHQNGVQLNDINSTNIKEIQHFDKNRKQLTTKIEQLSSQQKQAIITQMISNEKTIISLVKKGVQKHGNLQFKSEFNCIPLKQYGNSYVFKSFNKVRISGISGKILLRTGNQLQNVDELANAKLIRKPDGYYLKITTFTNKEKYQEQPKNGKEIGLDFGIKTTITTSEGEKIKISVEESERLKKLQKKMFRQVKGSNNRYKTVGLIKREYQKISNKKHDITNKLVSRLKHYEKIVIQDEQISGWHKGLFGKQVQHSCMGMIKSRLKQLPQTIVLDKWIPTTKMCPHCGTINQYITLNDRIFKCGCGYELDRDIHSAKNMLEIDKLALKRNLVPTEHREVTLEEFKTAVEKSFFDKSER